MSRRSGTLVLDCAPFRADIVFDTGKIVSGSIYGSSPGLGESLIEAGLVSRSQYPFMLLAEQEGKTLAEVFREFNISDAQLDQINEDLLKNAILTMLQWKQGTFAFESQEQSDPWKNASLVGARYVVHRGLSPQYLAMEGARIEDEQQKGAENKATSCSPQGTLASVAQTLMEDSDPFRDFEDTTAPALDLEEKTEVTDMSERFFDLRKELGNSIDEAEVPTKVVSTKSIGLQHDNEMSILRSMLAELKEAQSREQVVLLVLRFAGFVLERAAIFVPNADSFHGLSGFCSVTLAATPETAESYMLRVRSLKIKQKDDGIFQKAQKLSASIVDALEDTPANRQLLEGLGGVFHKNKTLVAPVIAGNAIALILFGDNPSGKSLGSIDGLEIFLQQAGNVIERLERK